MSKQVSSEFRLEKKAKEFFEIYFCIGIEDTGGKAFWGDTVLSPWHNT